MAVVRYEPWALFNQLQSEINRLFDTRTGVAPGEDSSTVVTSAWMPAVDIREDQDRFTLFADIPGVQPKDIEITMENGVLTIRGERRLESEEEREGFKRVERARGTFYRRFSLPDSADPERVSAKGKDGVLEITIPKHERVQPRKISVES
jgi:HSP20 family protein